nr:MAG TPA: hypothetical protein [Caudoviricetes sp.]
MNFIHNIEFLSYNKSSKHSRRAVESNHIHFHVRNYLAGSPYHHQGLLSIQSFFTL